MNVFSIPPTLSFVDALADGLLTRAGGDALALSRMTVLLPNRRAVRALREAFLRKTSGAALLLPTIRPIGDVDEDALSLGPGVETLTDLSAVQPLRRQLVLAQYMCAAMADRFTIAQALPMAAELGRLIDSVHTEGLSLEDLGELVPTDYADHWGIILTFLERVVHRHWDDYLKKERVLDPGLHRRLMIEAYTKHLQSNPPAGPVIAAGSTGSIPSTAALLKTVAELPQGCVVLPGLDRILDEKSWGELHEGHPQAGLARLLLEFGITRAQVQNWDGTSDTPNTRETLISALMRPAETLGDWSKNPLPTSAFEGITRIEAETLDDEAGAIAAIMRDHAQKTDTRETCVLVTPDRVLAGRVAQMLTRWNIRIDDSAGVPLSQTPQGAWLLLLTQVLQNDLPPLEFLAALKHPLAAGGSAWPKDAPPYRTFVRLLDRHVLRGPRPAPGFTGLFQRLRDVKTIDAPTRNKIKSGLRALERLFSPAITKTDPAERIRALALLAEELAATLDQKGAQRLWVGDGGEAAADVFSNLFEQNDVLPDLDWNGVHALLDSAFGNVAVRPRFGTHPRLAILGPIEARLYGADIMILGGLNEGTWPRIADVDGWMSRPMREKFGLPAPERAITLSAHDFAQGLGAARVYLTRAANRDGAPTIPARWLQRLDALCDLAGGVNLRAGGEYWLSIARALDAPDGPAKPVTRPVPNPPITSRPRELRVTEIANLRREPYGIYAQHVLGLKPLDAIDAEPDARIRGTLIHEALENFTRKYPGKLPDNAEAELIAIGKTVFDEAHAHPDIHGHWWPRFMRMARALIPHEQDWRNAMEQCWAEASGEMTIDVPGGFTLRGRADRIEKRDDGWAVIDYKSGQSPAKNKVLAGDEPQLSLLGMMLRDGAFDGELKQSAKGADITALQYWPTNGGSDDFKAATINEKDLNALCDAAKDGLANMMRAYLVDGIPYICWPDADRPLRDDYDYAHLARIAEWSGEDDSEDAA